MSGTPTVDPSQQLALVGALESRVVWPRRAVPIALFCVVSKTGGVVGKAGAKADEPPALDVLGHGA
jgi:hypothetical protein